MGRPFLFWKAANGKGAAGIALKKNMGGRGGADGKTGIIAKIALQKNIDGFFQGIAAYVHIAGEAGIELGSPVGFDQNEPV